MKATSSTYKQLIATGNTRTYKVKIVMTLANGTVLPDITEADIWADSFKIDTAVSGTDSFDIGCAIIGMCRFTLENFDERYNRYDFFNASAVVWVGLEGDTDNGTQVYYRMGFFTVDEPVYNGGLINLELLDNKIGRAHV